MTMWALGDLSNEETVCLQNESASWQDADVDVGGALMFDDECYLLPLVL